ncbi:succinate dehydrogenase assembly factor 4, mitochondrial-like [Amphibalanus amphitrite]|uniref:succinate dehydrogenase assembly factor 4, mitochondrial-like n=1 Tax=Amphibalanus amphitrite TaxID=1232801 RepID=UPI001C925311|nr:succinate dehydrogenase assembly factor 4, mitochondrial-like [Amphibalanus amphitrite]
MAAQLLRTALSHQCLQLQNEIRLTAARALSVSAQAKQETPKDGVTCGRSATNNPVKAKTPIGRLDEPEEGARHPYQEKEPLPEFPDGVNPSTGEIGGPRGPEPTRYGDWERKGRVTDF